tara:strand:- start:7931 stop:8212 length:282 start_codon:yes stop_codon:yes gene_type:complete
MHRRYVLGTPEMAPHRLRQMTTYAITVEGTTHTMKSKVADYTYAVGVITEGTVHKPGFSRKLESVMKIAKQIRFYNNGSTPYVVEIATGNRLI